MITLTKRLRQESEGQSKPTKTKKEESRVSIRDKLLVKEVMTARYQQLTNSDMFIDTRVRGSQTSWCQDQVWWSQCVVWLPCDHQSRGRDVAGGQVQVPCQDSSGVQHVPTWRGLSHQALASQHLSGWCNMFVTAQTSQLRWTGMGSHKVIHIMVNTTPKYFIAGKSKMWYGDSIVCSLIWPTLKTH